MSAFLPLSQRILIHKLSAPYKKGFPAPFNFLPAPAPGSGSKTMVRTVTFKYTLNDLV